MDKWISKSKSKKTKDDEESTIKENRPSREEHVSKKKQSPIFSGFRKYNDNYLEFVFYWNKDESHPNPQCVICHELWSNHSLKPSLLLRHFQNVHPNLKNKPVDYVEKKTK
jgi:hypothetical protein